MGSSMRRILCVVGTRPEAIKMAPVVLALRKQPWADVRVLATAQHRELLDQVLKIFAIRPDVDLDLMRPDQDLGTLTARLLDEVGKVLQAQRPDAVLAQGDTTTVMAVAMSCFYHRIAFGHVEAGLRTHDMANPFPEEMNRVVAGRLTRWHFAPTESARDNLVAEGIARGDIWVTGNTVIDALHSVAERRPAVGIELAPHKRLVLVTSHRRENFGEPLRNICRAVRTLVERNRDIAVLYPVHPNPNVGAVAKELLGGHPRITLCQPLDYLPFVGAMQRAHLILSDSGGVQEEAPALGRPVLVLREETERPEAVRAGVVKLVGADFERIVDQAQQLLDDEDAYRQMARGVSPYGDGHAAGRIVDILRRQVA
ncbi:MAG: non-hydrolyzing UDP-N-acetylglucosamine 2-epimerase [Burkholderiaceae bacterium]